ncbi:hypothetical protein [Thermocrinis sp.]
MIDNKVFWMSFFKNSLTIKTSVSIDGFLSAERGLLGGTSYDDKEWARVVLENSKIMSLKENLPHFSSLKISDGTLKITLWMKRMDKGAEEEVKKAIQLLLDVIPSLENLPSSPVGSEKERLRLWILYYIPAGLSLFLMALGFYWLTQGYGDALCEDELFLLGVKVLTPIFLFHLTFSLLVLGKHFHFKTHLPALAVLYFAGFYLIPLAVLNPFNARFDRSEPKRVETKVLKKYHAHRGGHRLVVEYRNCSFRVSERSYKSVYVGDTLVLYLKDGAFGVEWVYRYHVKY